MTTEVDTAGNGTQTAGRRDRWRHEIADLLELDPVLLPDSARLVEDVGLDSLAMMSLLIWMETRGVIVGTDRGWPATIGDLLSLVEKAAVPGLSIRVTGGQDLGLPGPTDVALPGLAGSPGSPGMPQSPAPVLAPVLSSPTFRLTPIEQSDLDFLYTLATQAETSFRWRYHGAPPPPERFAAELWTQVLVQYVARRTADNQPVGQVVAYGADPGMHHAYVGAVFQPQHTGTGLPAQVVALFVRYLFHTFPLHKLYLEVPGFNWPQMQSGEDRLFRVEGVLRDHHYYAGRRWDQYLCAIYPDQLTTDPR
jgi:RimJ/RimL family protein N-acetyltransferase/aryl carrier-like protein